MGNPGLCPAFLAEVVQPWKGQSHLGNTLVGFIRAQGQNVLSPTFIRVDWLWTLEKVCLLLLLLLPLLFEVQRG